MLTLSREMNKTHTHTHTDTHERARALTRACRAKYLKIFLEEMEFISYSSGNKYSTQHSNYSNLIRNVWWFYLLNHNVSSSELTQSLSEMCRSALSVLWIFSYSFVASYWGSVRCYRNQNLTWWIQKSATYMCPWSSRSTWIAVVSWPVSKIAMYKL